MASTTSRAASASGYKAECRTALTEHGSGVVPGDPTLSRREFAPAALFHARVGTAPSVSDSSKTSTLELVPR